MNNFLERILATKEREVQQLLTQKIDVQNALQLPKCRGFAASIRMSETLAVVAEIKKASPSKGVIQPNFKPVEQALTYDNAGASAISILTDVDYFQGSLVHLTSVRNEVNIPVLRKDFIIHEVQIDEARVAGADAILLICAALSKDRLCALATYAKSLGMDVLIEVHSVLELDAAFAAEPSVLGINNRDLHTFEVNLATTAIVMREISSEVIVLSESGITTAADAEEVARYGVTGVLVGESLMRFSSTSDVTAALQALKVPRDRLRQSVGSSV